MNTSSLSSQPQKREPQPPHLKALELPGLPSKVTCKCRRCNRTLRKPATVEAGIGVVCAKREAEQA